MGDPEAISRARSRSHQKGNAFEREAAKLLSKAVYGRDNVLRRTPLSGGWSAKSNGDIIVDPTALRSEENSWNVYVECKNYRSFSLIDFFPGLGKATPMLEKFWSEASIAAKTKKPILLFRANGWKTAIATVRLRGFPLIPYRELGGFWNGEDIALFYLNELERPTIAEAIQEWALT